MNHKNHEILGFDVRLFAEDYVDKRWDTKNRELYLLKPEIKWPLSVDEWVWPSVFALSDKELELKKLGYPPEYLPFEGVIKVKPVNFYHQVLSLWTDFEDMKTCYFESVKKINKLPQKTIPIIISLLTDVGPFIDGSNTNYYKYWSTGLFPGINMKIPADWVSLGYDIADNGFITGLSNCGYDRDEKELLQKTWSSRLNEYGLIQDVREAREFKEITDKRVPEHAPFYVYELWRAPKCFTL
ncbi:MAG: hypothetical protein M1491_02230 [Deltaproteobacteria bacterium]|nr:hypothetical protein [Deltaproteobacteria bacterium]MCL5278175.1 hypothetical protein [Deltaproteobacteria bacterium]